MSGVMARCECDGRNHALCADAQFQDTPVTKCQGHRSRQPQGDTLFIITDNLSSHNSLETRTWVAEHPRIQTSSFPKGPVGSMLQTRGRMVGASSARRPSLARASPNAKRSSEQCRGHAQRNRRASRGYGGRRQNAAPSPIGSFLTAFEERSTRLSNARIIPAL